MCFSPLIQTVQSGVKRLRATLQSPFYSLPKRQKDLDLMYNLLQLLLKLLLPELNVFNSVLWGELHMNIRCKNGQHNYHRISVETEREVPSLLLASCCMRLTDFSLSSISL